MKRIALIILFSIFAVIGVFMAAMEETIAVAFVYVIGTLASGFLCTYFALNENNWK